MKTSFFKLISFMLCLVLCNGALAACRGGQTADSETTVPISEPDATQEAPERLMLVSDGTSEFAVIRPDEPIYNGAEVKAAQTIKKAVNAVSGVPLDIASDFLTRNDDNSERFEILIGATNRPESAAAIAELTEEDEYIVRISGKKVVIAANSSSAMSGAVAYFLSEFVGWVSETEFTPSSSIELTEGEYKTIWVHPNILPENAVPNGIYGLTQAQVDEKFAELLDGLFTGKTVETIAVDNIGGSFAFHFPDIIYVNGEYWAYYICYATNTGNGGVGLATSTDGINWDNKGCVIQPDEDWDCNGTYFAGVWLDDDGTFYCTYECKGKDGTKYGMFENIALATSKDGINWEKHGVILYADRTKDSWQKVNIGTPDLYKVGDVWYLFFHGFDSTECRVGLAYGKDLFNLTVLVEPIIDTEDDTLWSGTIGRRDLIYCGGYYYMVYEISTDKKSSGGYAAASWTHMFARSRDLVNWEITDGPQLIQPTTGFGYDGPCWMVIGDKLYVYMRNPANYTTAVELTFNK